jgi:hypothetical protein
VVLHVVEEARQVEVNDSRLALHYRFGHSLYVLVRGALGSVSIRAWLKVTFKNRVENELERALDDAVPNRWNLEDPLSGSALRNRVLASRQWSVTS